MKCSKSYDQMVCFLRAYGIVFCFMQMVLWNVKVGLKLRANGVLAPIYAKAAEQGYKACASLTKSGEQYGTECLEAACVQVLAYGTMHSIRSISSMLKNKHDKKPVWFSIMLAKRSIPERRSV